MAKLVIDATVKVGELLDDLSGSTAGTTIVLPENISKKISHYYQTLFKESEKVDEIVDKILTGEGIPMWNVDVNLQDDQSR